MWLTSYGPNRHRPKSLRSDDSRVKNNQQLLGGWGRAPVAMKPAERILAGEETPRASDPGVVASG
jgi:hypothetical protein